MTYIVNQNCIKCKLMDCVEVCPVECIIVDPARVEDVDLLLKRYHRLIAS